MLLKKHSFTNLHYLCHVSFGKLLEEKWYLCTQSVQNRTLIVPCVQLPIF